MTTSTGKTAKTARSAKNGADTGLESLETIGLTAVDLVQTNLNAAFDVTRAIFRSRDPQEITELQAGYVRDALARNLDGIRKIGDLSRDAFVAANPVSNAA